MKLGMPALALSDHGNLCNAPAFYKAARDAGIEPVLGQEFYFVPDNDEYREMKGERFHITILARGSDGYRVVSDLSTQGHQHYHYKPCIDRKIINALSKKDRAALTVMSGCAGSIISQMLLGNHPGSADDEVRWWKKKFPNYFIELMHHDTSFDVRLNMALIELAKRHGIEWVITNDPHYAHKKDACHHDALLAIQTGSDLDDPDRFRFDGKGYHLRSQKEIEKAFKRYGKDIWQPGIKQTAAIAKDCHVRIPSWETKTWHIPKYPFVSDAFKEVERLIQKGLKRRGLDKDKRYVKRAKREMKAFRTVETPNGAGMADFLLITLDAITEANKRGIPVGPGRGSVCGTLVGYLIGVHKIDPIKYDLLFERFFNPERPKMPDVDTDYSAWRRDEILAYYPERYGEGNTAPVAAFGTMQARRAFQSLAKTHGIEFKERLALSDKILEDEDGEVVWPEEVRKKYPDIIESVGALLGLKASLSSHPAGVVVFDPEDPIKDICPSMWIPDRAGKPGRMVMQYNLAAVDLLMLLKQDTLGLRSLDTIAECVRMVKERHGVELDPDSWVPNEEKKDREVFRMLARGETHGVFQMEGGTNHMGIQKIKPVEFEDIVTCFPAETEVHGPVPLGAVKRPYEGEMVTITFASGHTLTSTPNHPLLCNERWIPAGELQAGDNLLRSNLGEGMALGDPEVEDRPTQIGKVYNSLLNEGKVERIPFTDVNLYGDRPDTDVDVVATNRLLRHRSEPGTFDDMNQLSLVPTYLGLGDLVAPSAACEHSFGKRPASSLVSSLGQGHAFFGGCLSHPQDSGFRSSSYLDTAFTQSDNYMRTAHSVPDAERLSRFAAEVTTDEIVKVERFTWSGHVYTLKTVDGWYLANGIVAGNCTSLYRAGPMVAGADKRYLDNKKDKKVRVIHEKLRPMLERSWGEMIYQEQMFAILNEVAGLSWARVDDAKTATSKKNAQMMAAVKENAVKGFVSNGIPEATAEKIWKMIASQSLYLFNRSHAVAYSMITYQMARLKYLYPLEFYAALLRTVEGKSKEAKARREEYMKAAVREGFKILPPDINLSDDRFVPNGEDELLFGLVDIKGVGVAAYNKIMEHRASYEGRGHAFNSTEAVVRVLGTRDREKGIYAYLAACGALRNLGVEPDEEKQTDLLAFQFADHMVEMRAKYGDKIKRPKGNNSRCLLYGEIVKTDKRKTRAGVVFYVWLIRWQSGEEYSVNVWSDASDLFKLQKGSIVRVRGNWKAAYSNVSVSDSSQVKVYKSVLPAPAEPKKGKK